MDFSDEIGLGEDERIEVWECGETGTWFVDVAAGRATYIEDNLWGEVPIEADAPWRPWVVPSHDARIDSTTSRDSVARLVAEARAVAPGEEGVAVWMDTRHPAGDVIRSLEAEIFPDVMRYLTPAVERRCRLLAVLDLRDEGSLMHCFRVSAHHFEPGDIDPGSSGLAMVDEVIDENPGITLEQVVDHYAARGVDLRRCIAVETSFRVRPGSSPNGMRWSDVGYLAIAREVLERTTSGGAHGIFGHMNQATLRSLAAIGVELEPFCGDESIRSPASRVGATEDRFWPLFVPETPGNLDVFRVLTTLAIPSVVLEPVIDLRDSAPSPLSFEVVPVEDDVG